MQFARCACRPQDVWDLLRHLLSLSHPADNLRKGKLWPEANGRSSVSSLDPWAGLAHFSLGLFFYRHKLHEKQQQQQQNEGQQNVIEKKLSADVRYIVFLCFSPKTFNLKLLTNINIYGKNKSQALGFHIIQKLFWDEL